MPNKQLNNEINEINTSVGEISNKLNGVDIKELKALMDDICNKRNGIEKNYKKINEMDYFFKILDDMELGLKAWGENHDELKGQVTALQNENK